MVKPDTGAGKLSWRPSGATGAGSWKALGVVDTVPFVAPERLIEDANTIGSAMERSLYVQQRPRDVTLDCRLTTFAFLAYCMQSDPEVADRHVTGLLYKSQNVGKLIEVAYDDGTIRYTAQSVAVKAVKLTAGEGAIPRCEVTLSVPKIVVGAPGDPTHMVDFDTANVISIEETFIGIGGAGAEVELEAPEFSFTVEPNITHGDVVGASYHEAVNHGNVKFTLDIEGYYDSGLFQVETGFTPTAANRYLANIGDTTGSHYISIVVDSPIELDADFELTGDHAVRMTKKLRARTAPTILFKDATYAAARYWT